MMTVRWLIVFSGSTFLLVTAPGASDARAGERSVREPPRLGSERAIEQHLAEPAIGFSVHLPSRYQAERTARRPDG